MTAWQRTVTIAAVLMVSACGGEKPEPDSEQNVATSPVSVRAVAVETTDMRGWLYSQGTARSTRREFLTFPGQGRVTYIDPELRVGSPVRAGQLIANLEPDRLQADLNASRAEQNEARAALALARVTVQRYETLIEQKSASAQELDQARVQLEQAEAGLDRATAQVTQAQVALDESRLVSPINGVLARLNIEQGRYFSSQTIQTSSEQGALRSVPALVIDPDHFEVRVDLPAYNFRQISLGAQALIGDTPPVNGNGADERADDDQIHGIVHAIGPSLDPETRTFEVVIRTLGEQPRLQDGEFVSVWIAEPERKDVLSVPLDALRFRNDQAFVFVVDAEQTVAHERLVSLGPQAGDRRSVVSGLKVGEQVVTEGRAKLADGQAIRLLKAPDENQTPEPTETAR